MCQWAMGMFANRYAYRQAEKEVIQPKMFVFQNYVISIQLGNSLDFFFISTQRCQLRGQKHTNLKMLMPTPPLHQQKADIKGMDPPDCQRKKGAEKCQMGGLVFAKITSLGLPQRLQGKKGCLTNFFSQSSCVASSFGFSLFPLKVSFCLGSLLGRTPRGSCNRTLLRRVLRRFFKKGSAFLEGFLEVTL